MEYSWMPFYRELSNELLAFRNRRDELIKLVLRAYDVSKIKMPKLDSTGIPSDMDPFTVFGMFNKQMKESSRIAFCAALKDLLSISADVPTDFDGIPLLNPLGSTFYCFTDDARRGTRDIDDLWSCYDAAIRYADHSGADAERAFISAYDAVKDLTGIKWKLSIGLFWIRPDSFLNLDSRNQWFLNERCALGEAFAAKLASMKGIPDGKKYMELCRDSIHLIKNSSGYGSIAELSSAAWNASEAENKKQENRKEAQDNDAEATDVDRDVRQVHYWLYAPCHNAEQWDNFYNEGIMAIGWGETGDLRDHASREAIKEKLRAEWNRPESPALFPSLALWQLLHEMKIGDVIFVKQGRKKIVGRGIVTSDYAFVDNYPVEDYYHQREIRWTHKGLWNYPRSSSPIKTLTDMTAYTDIVEDLKALFEDEVESEDEPPVTPPDIPKYAEKDFLNDVYMDEASYRDLVGLIRQKKNVILQGAPGVGKTYTAKRLAYSMMGVKDPDRVTMVQFHQSYSYEDFIMGIRPNETGFALRHGVFYDFCKKAEDDPDNEYFFIIDEINRGNLSKIFGELFMLIEHDKRGMELQLLYANERFKVPPNIYIIGTMNTADRSLAMMDYALRRRFSFFDMVPGFATDGFRAYRERLKNASLDRLVDCVEKLNEAIASDESLGEGFRIGHSYFSNLKSDTLSNSRLGGIVKYELVPLLKEYWFDEPLKVREWKAKLESALK